MSDGPVYLEQGWEDSPVPGWYFVNEADMYEGPYLTNTLAEEAKEWYSNYLNGNHIEGTK